MRPKATAESVYPSKVRASFRNGLTHPFFRMTASQVAAEGLTTAVRKGADVPIPRIGRVDIAARSDVVLGPSMEETIGGIMLSADGE
jgi:hypothetical protein